MIELVNTSPDKLEKITAAFNKGHPNNKQKETAIILACGHKMKDFVATRRNISEVYAQVKTIVDLALVKDGEKIKLVTPCLNLGMLYFKDLAAQKTALYFFVWHYV